MLYKGIHLAALRVDAGHDVFDGAVKTALRTPPKSTLSGLPRRLLIFNLRERVIRIQDTVQAIDEYSAWTRKKSAFRCCLYL